MAKNRTQINFQNKNVHDNHKLLMHHTASLNEEFVF